MKIITKQILLNTLVFLFFISPVFADGGGFQFSNPLKGTNNVYEVIVKIVDFILKVASIFVVLAIIYSGFLFIKAQGNDTKLTEAKNTFFYSIIGAVLILGARLLASIICSTVSSLGIDLSGACQ